MARLQDFQTVTPSASDNILIVQSQGQGLATVGSTIGAKMDKANPTGTGALSMNRASGSATGDYSVTLGRNCTASGDYSLAAGNATIASGNRSFAEGDGSTASGYSAHCEGITTTASGQASHVEGRGSIANHRSQHVFGEYNVADPSTAAASSKGNYIEIVGNGTSSTPANARTLDWNGNETIAGTLTQSSDARLKEVKSDDIPDVSSIKAVRFNWRKGTGRDFDEHIGYLAQDVEQVLPFLVKKDAEGNKALDYIAFLVAKVDSLEKRISELEKGE